MTLVTLEAFSHDIVGGNMVSEIYFYCWKSDKMASNKSVCFVSNCHLIASH